MKIREIAGMIAICVCIMCGEARAEVNSIEPDGENGYFKSAPEVIIKQNEDQIMRYRLEDANGKVLTGRLDSMLRTVTIQEGVLKDGENILDIWLEDENGVVVDSSMERKIYLVDQTPPEYPLQFVKNEVVEILAEDKTSGIEGIYYAIEGQEMQYLKGNHVFLALPEEFAGKICAYAVDRAGNQGESCYFVVQKEEKTEVITPEISKEEEEKDVDEPKIELSGIPDTGIESKSIVISCLISDDSAISELKGKMIQEQMDGTEVIYEMKEWKKTDQGYQYQREIVEDGIYQIEIEGKDVAGNIAYETRQIIIDTQAPQISQLNRWEGRRLEEFCWNYQMDDLVSDLTSWYAEIRLDGVLYKSGQVCKEQGKHILEVNARDLAGNEVKEVSTFYIHKSETNEEKIEVALEREELHFVKNEKIETQQVEIIEEEPSNEIYPLVLGGIASAGILVVAAIVIKKLHSK